MVVLKRIRSATLVEAIVATVIIVIIFIVASLVLNNILVNSFSKNSYRTESRMNELVYFASNRKIAMPYNEQYNDWDISITERKSGNLQYEVAAIATKGKYVIKKYRLCQEKN
jgi:uncharacterized membrane protein YhiD involved in acid resistance